MEITTTTVNRSPARRAAVNTLAVFGFIALILAGIALAIYSLSFIPNLSQKGGAAAFLSSLFHNADEDSNKLEVVTATTTLPIADEDVTATSTISTDTPKPMASTGSGHTTTVVRTVTTNVKPYGDPDLSVNITATGYCSSDNPDSFHKSNTITDNRNGGVQFTVKNIGTNVSGRWDFEYSLPTSATQRPVTNQRSLNPGDSVDYTLCFEKPRAGDNRLISVEVDTGNDVRESNERNNEDSVRVDIDT